MKSESNARGAIYLTKYPFISIFVFLYIASGIMVSVIDKKFPFEVAWLWLIQVIVIGITMYWTRNWKNLSVNAGSPAKPFLFVLTYAIIYIIFTVVAWKPLFIKSALSYQLIGLWLLLVIVPALFSKYMLGDSPKIGFRGGAFKKSLVLAVIVSLVLSPLLIAISPVWDALIKRSLSPMLIIGFPIIIVLSLLTAAIQEEYFFRGILQDHAQRFLKNDINAIAFTMIFFGIYHLPFILYDPEIMPKGFAYALAFTFLSKGMMGLGFGVLWLRTGNLVAPAFVHAWINALPNITRLKM